MRQAILDFPRQFEYRPVIVREECLHRHNQVILAGMGGSHLATDVLLAMDPMLPIRVHSNYGLPAWLSEEAQKETLFVASSYSGNTEETLDAYYAARAAGMSVAAVSVGGKLQTLAEEDGVPFIQLPNTGIQPRSALGFGCMAVLAFLGDEKKMETLSALSRLDVASFEEKGQQIADAMIGLVPVVAASTENAALAQNWKIKINETGKTPAFSNVFPELNHNEMTGFDTRDTQRPPSSGFGFVFLRDPSDHPRVARRMDVTAELYRSRGFTVVDVELSGATREERLVSGLLLADWTALSLAERYGLESEQVPMVEELKKRI